ncbi:unnamed protein product [Arctogadus glacialis]
MFIITDKAQCGSANLWERTLITVTERGGCISLLSVWMGAVILKGNITCADVIITAAVETGCKAGRVGQGRITDPPAWLIYSALLWTVFITDSIHGGGGGGY